MTCHNNLRVGGPSSEFNNHIFIVCLLKDRIPKVNCPTYKNRTNKYLLKVSIEEVETSDREIFDKSAIIFQPLVSRGLMRLNFCLNIKPFFYDYFSKKLFINSKKEKYIVKVHLYRNVSYKSLKK